MSIKSYATSKPKQILEPFTYEPAPLGPLDIDVKITHCGICHSDIHLIDNDWGSSTYPLVPGHEIVGIITELGPEVKNFKKGQRVGIGWQRSSCMCCDWCGQGEENLCLKQEATCVGHQGGFADKIRTDSRFAFPIPDALASEHAAPLLCGGATVFSPLITNEINPTHKVGVIGIGGLGHLALQFANAFGCEVTAFSSSPDKKNEAIGFGAHHFLSSNDASAIAKAANTLDFILCTSMSSMKWTDYINMLRPKGKLCFVGAVEKPIEVPFFSLVFGSKGISASNIASRPHMKQMLETAAKHGIKAKIEEFPLKDVNKAIEKVRSGKIRYRAVLTNS